MYSSYEAAHTIGDWHTEEDSCVALDAILGELGLWRVYREVGGLLIQPRGVQNQLSVRIDRVLIPTARLLGMGWRHGAIGIEVKRSGEKIGPPIAQAMDYLRSVWQLPSVKVMLDWVFIWPMCPQSGTVESILAQQRIGSACATKWNKLLLSCGNNILRVSWDGTVEIGAGTNGRKVGSH